MLTRLGPSLAQHVRRPKRPAFHPITKLKMEMTMRLQQRPFTVEIKKKRPLAKPAPALPVSSIKHGKPA
jgi:hypothetical protein